MALSPEELATLHTELQKPTYAAMTDGQRWSAIHAATTVPNPAPQGQVPRPFFATTLTLAVDVSRRPGMVPFLGDIAPMIAVQDRAGIGYWGAELLLLGFLAQADIDAITVILTATVPDPEWPETVPGPSVKTALFGAETWAISPTQTIDYILESDVTAAR